MQEIIRSGATAVRYRTMMLAAGAVALVALSFHGALDDFAREQVRATTTQSVGIYAAARLADAAVSVLQTSELRVPLLASIKVGELLDPVNDALERLSSVMVWAIGSLFLQRIILEIASGAVVKWTFLALGLSATAALLLCEWERSRGVFLRTLAIPEAVLYGCRNLMIRVFVIAVIFRFIVPVFMALGFLFSQMILGSEIDRNSETLSSLGTEVRTDSVEESPLADQRRQQEIALEGLAGELESLERESETLKEEIGALKDEAGWRRWLPGRIGGRSPGEALASARERRKETKREMDRVRQRIKEENKTLECIDRQLAGKSCQSFRDRLSSVGKAGARIREIVAMAGDVATSMARLLAAVVVKNIVIPLVFLVIAVKCCRPMIRVSMRLVQGGRREVEDLRREAEDLRRMLARKDQEA